MAFIEEYLQATPQINAEDVLSHIRILALKEGKTQDQVKQDAITKYSKSITDNDLINKFNETYPERRIGAYAAMTGQKKETVIQKATKEFFANINDDNLRQRLNEFPEQQRIKAYAAMTGQKKGKVEEEIIARYSNNIDFLKECELEDRPERRIKAFAAMTAQKIEKLKLKAYAEYVNAKKPFSQTSDEGTHQPTKCIGEMNPNSLLRGNRYVDFGYEITIGGQDYFLFIGHTATHKYYCELLTKRANESIAFFPRIISFLRNRGFDHGGNKEHEYIYKSITQYNEEIGHTVLENTWNDLYSLMMADDAATEGITSSGQELSNLK